MKTAESRLDCIDFLRGLSALAVLMYHARVITWSGMTIAFKEFGWSAPLSVWIGYLSLPFRFGFTGVTFFFVISGYCIHRGNHRVFSRTQPITNGLASFLWRRFIRIYPTLFFALIATAALDYYGGKYGPTGALQHNISFRNFTVSLFSLQNIYSTHYGSNYSLWSLAVEEHIYLIYPLMLFVSRSQSFMRLLALTFIVSLVTSTMWENQPGRIFDFLPYWFSWTMGALVAEVEARNFKWIRLPYRGIFALTVGAFFWLELHGRSLSAQSSLSISAACCLCWVLQWKNSDFFSWKVSKLVSQIGRMSYSLYILHVPFLFFWVSTVMQGSRPTSFLPAIPAIVFALAGSTLFYYAVEQWSLKRRSIPKKAQIPLDDGISQAA